MVIFAVTKQLGYEIYTIATFFICIVRLIALYVSKDC